MSFHLKSVILFCALFCTQPALSAEQSCPKGTKIAKEKDLKKIRMSVETAISSGNQTTIESLAACDFMLSKPESDTGGFRRGKNIAHDLTRLLKGMKFKTIGADFKTQVNVAVEVPNRGYELIYRTDDSVGWYWAGLVIADSKTLEKLLIDSY